eukprot:CAMPEP_0184396562 /NCGR_PEP_ID=MMETSP0007-20130409/52882_1 /TAXON_ID=97485 /ORGANISM="Prymnesium parvum, Strain Texoma1" /LENGTH=61 /DNA_ID=CAMNT_0026749423 /DNA_START=297 /DNA_END=479 /DNA_ORIENTATION=-
MSRRIGRSHRSAYENAAVGLTEDRLGAAAPLSLITLNPILLSPLTGLHRAKHAEVPAAQPR